MNLAEKLTRSRSIERIDFSKYRSIGKDDPLVAITTDNNILVEPCWTIEGDWEGERYRDYIASHPNYRELYLRSELALRLETAAKTLGNAHKLVIRAGHRPIEVQRRILIDCADEYKTENPGISDEAALEHAREFVSDPDSTLPPHVCGAAVDVLVLDSKTGESLDFGSKLNDDTETSFLYYPHLTQIQKDNRLILTTSMLNAGLASCTPEWWHFSYGDQVWAWFYGEENSLYSPVDL